MRADAQSQLQIRRRDGTGIGANRDASTLLRDMAIWTHARCVIMRTTSTGKSKQS